MMISCSEQLALHMASLYRYPIDQHKQALKNLGKDILKNELGLEAAEVTHLLNQLDQVWEAFQDVHGDSPCTSTSLRHLYEVGHMCVVFSEPNPWIAQNRPWLATMCESRKENHV